ncbi:MAG: S-layer homology domain-containing protein [Epulopiscium sp.]|jgi:hypothetical protein|nr:S-layer homology domain-containing protein [Candidatus Epulonipiscium sp.]HOQ16858.1 S-layer homology domain-containing protein [Defluviitaleaceae bacterium]HPT75599.1 S-layer homology domain-containing protein [Defluviitaleaceae bacterium]
MKKLFSGVFFFIFFFLLFSSNGLAKAREEYGLPLASYKGEKGVTIVSFSYNWASQEKLKEVYDELLKNFHGEEIKYLTYIYIYPDSPEGVLACYYEDYDINSEGEYVYKPGRYIEIFNGDQYTDVSQFARVLAHEYGHHFTLYYLMTKENKHFNQWKETNYAKIRGLEKYKEVGYFSVQDNRYSYQWDVAEIAANDYVQLFGSPNAKKSTDYKDVQERVEQNIKASYYSTDSFNLSPQENLSIPLAADVPGLYLYWLGLAGYTSMEPDIPVKPQISIKKHKEIMSGYFQYEVTWNPISKYDEYEYTLVAYPAADYIIFPRPIKTVSPGESTKAYFGSAMHQNENGTVNLILDDQYEGEFYFRLFIKDKRGFIFSTEPVKYDFNKDKVKSIYRMTDIPPNHWAIHYIETIIDKKIAEGYEDGTFRPEGEITKVEFMAMLMRAIHYERMPEEDGRDWFEKEGYLEAARQLNLVNISDCRANYNQLNDPITREEMAFMAGQVLKYLGYRYEKGYQAEFKDIGQVKYKDEISLAVYYYIINGYPDGSFKPERHVTRAEASKVIYKLLDFVD